MSTLVPYVPDTCNLTLRWRTDVLKFDSGGEHRVCLDQLPDVLVEMSFSFDNALAEYLRHLRLRLFTDLLETYEVPFRHEGVAVLAIGATTLDVATDEFADHAVVGRRLFVEATDVDDVTTGLALTVSAVAYPSAGVTRLTVGAGIATYSAATAMVCPLHTLQPLDNQGIGRYRGEATGEQAGEWAFSGRVTSHYTQGTARTPATLDGHFVLLHRPRQEDGEVAAEEFDAGLEFSDLGGSFTVDTGRSYADTLREHTYFCPFSEWNEWKELLWRLYGQQVAFLTPTWREDLVFTETPAAGDDFITVEYGTNPDFRTWYAASSHRYVMVMWSDGVNDVVKVLSVVDGVTELQLNLSADLTGTGTARACFLELTRLATDDVAVTLTPGGLEIGLSLQVMQSWSSPAWPANPTEMRLALGSVGTWSYGWDFDDVTGYIIGLTPRFGGVRLYDAGGADYLVPGAFSGDSAVGLTGGEMEGFGPADNTFLDLDASTSYAEFLSFSSNGPAVAGQVIASKGTATTYRKLVVENTSGHLTLSVRSGGGSVVSTTLAFNFFDGEPHQILSFIDRTAQRIQLVSDLGVSTAADITTVGSLVAAAQPWSFGANFDIPLVTAPIDVHFLAIALADIVNLRAAGAAAITAIREWIGLQ